MAEHISSLHTDKQVVTTYGAQVLSTPSRDTSLLAPCSHEEADTRMTLHLADAVNQGFQKILLKTVDTDVFYCSLSSGSSGQDRNPGIMGRLWNWSTLSLRIAAHEIASVIGPDKSKALPVCHAYTGCDTVSSFNTKGKEDWVRHVEGF